MKKFFICGDFVPTKTNEEFFIKNEVERIVGKDILNFLSDNSYVIANLEAPISNKIMPIDKNGPNLVINQKVIIGFKIFKNLIFSLSNNHILDQGYYGLISTIDILKKYNISYFGAGINAKEASKEYVIYIENKSIALFACCEHEFSVAENIDEPSANPFDIFTTYDMINSLKSKYDYVIVLYHGGKEHFRYPSPYLQKLCRKLIDKGADLIVCQHSHCVGCKEVYSEKNIIYGQGNFLFDLDDNEYWNTSILLEVKIENDKLIVKEIPIVKDKNKIRLANEKENKEILSKYEKRSQNILNDNFVIENFRNFTKKEVQKYLNGLLGQTIFIRILNKLLLKKAYCLFYNQKSLLRIINHIECETHREIFLSGLKEMVKRKKK